MLYFPLDFTEFFEGNLKGADGEKNPMFLMS